MAATPSTMTPLGTRCPYFSLTSTEGSSVSLDDFESAHALLVMFVCNHCPFVKHLRQGFVRLARDYEDGSLAIVAISSNDVTNYPDDSPEKMAEEAIAAGYTFPYLFDATQEVAKSFQAACTPDFFLYDGERKLTYRGQFDDARPSNEEPVTGADLRAAIDAVLEGKPAPGEQKPSIGCNIKWKPGNEPAYF